MTDVAIDCQAVTKRFRIPTSNQNTLRGKLLHPFDRTTWREFEAVDNVSLDVRDGEFFGIVGRNGSGKSTLLKMIAGIYRPSVGTIDVRGSVASFIELGVGFNADLTGRENLFMNGALLGLSRRELLRRYDEIVDFAELHDFMDLKLRNYSSGMQVRLAFSVALQSGSDILLTDEVLAVGDERFQSKCFDIFRTYKSQGRTIVFVSHDMGVVQQFCDRAALLDNGQLRSVDEAWKITNEYHRLNAPVGVVDADRIDADAPVTFTEFNVAHDKGHSTELLPGRGASMHVRAKFRTRVERPNVGVTVSTPRGLPVFTLTTDGAGHDLPTHEAGDELKVGFAFDVALTPGSYVARWWVRDARGEMVNERANDQVYFSIIGDHDEGIGVLRPPYRGVIDSPRVATDHVSS